MSPKHSIAFCPICGGGLCGIRICGNHNEGDQEQFNRLGNDGAHGLVICDECEAIWLEPDVSTAHQYPDIEDPKCPICSTALWGEKSHWANAEQIERLGWDSAVNHDLDANTPG